jgi:hypothetical protein
MKTLTISTNNEKMWAMLLAFVQQHSFDFQAVRVEEKEQASPSENYVLHLAQNPLSLSDVEPMSREEIYA